MHLLYLDESGAPGNFQEQYFVLAGLSVPESSTRWLSNQIAEIAKGIDKDKCDTIELHAAEIYRGKTEPWTKYVQATDRVNLIKKVIRTLDLANSQIVAFAVAIEKKHYPGQDPVLLAFEEITDRFNHHLERISTSQDKQRGLIVLDKTSYESGLQSLAKSFRQNGNRWGSQLRSIAEIPLFVDSKACRITQLADHIAYAVFRRYERNDISYFDCIANRFNLVDGIYHGLVHRHSQHRSCTCPAC